MLNLENRRVAMAQDRRKVAAALTGAVTVLNHQETRGASGNARPQQAVDQPQPQLGPGHQAGGGDQVAIVDDGLMGMEFDLRVTRGERLDRGPVGGGAATVEQTAFGQQDRAYAHAPQGRASSVLLTHPFDQRGGCLAFGKTANRRRDQQCHQRPFGTWMTVVGTSGYLVGIHLPVADPQQRQLRAPMLGGNAVGNAKQIGQAVYRGQLCAGIDQHAQFGDCASHAHCQFSPCYCRCGQSSKRLPNPILRATSNRSRKHPWPSKHSS
ncbi:hypothetical protein D3C85_1141000 [compost metagenome]